METVFTTGDGGVLHNIDYSYSYDDNGNLSLRVDDQTGQTRQILWNEENRITSLSDQGKETIFRYDDGGTRIFKSGKYGENRAGVGPR